MKIGIDGSRAFIEQRTGIEEYSYQVIKNLRKKICNKQVFLYLKKEQKIDFDLPDNWKIRRIKIPIFWTQIGLSLEMIFRQVDVLFVPSHTLPFFHPKNSIVVIHGLEYEILPETYSFWARWYMRFFIKRSCQIAKTIVAVSKNTKKDLIYLYKIPENKIKVIYEGVSSEHASIDSDQYDKYKPFMLFIGRLEKRKNIEGIVSTFEILKNKHKISHKLVLAGSPGFGYLDIKHKIEASEYRAEIIETGFVEEKNKWQLMREAEIFLFPTFYEGFGLPILEAQSLGVPVVTSNVSSFPEVTGGSAFLVDPKEPKVIAQAIISLISDNTQKNDIIRKGYENVKKFSWEKCSSEIAELLMI